MSQHLTTIYILRHGESEANINKQIGLIPKASLTIEGRNQVKKAAQNFVNVHFDFIFSSDFVRAHQTAEIIASEKKLIVQTTKALRERSYGRLNGKTFDEIRKELKGIYEKYEKLSEREKFTTKLVEDMETTQSALERTLIYLRELGVGYPGKTLLLVTHVSLMRALLIHLGFCDYEEITSKNIANAAYFKIETDGVDFFLKETRGISKRTL
jgi:broad specificity phosphatase PhoE